MKNKLPEIRDLSDEQLAGMHAGFKSMQEKAREQMNDATMLMKQIEAEQTSRELGLRPGMICVYEERDRWHTKETKRKRTVLILRILTGFGSKILITAMTKSNRWSKREEQIYRVNENNILTPTGEFDHDYVKARYPEPKE